MTTKKSVIFWTISIILSLLFGFYQRITGPTYPLKGNVEIGAQKINFKLPRTHEGQDNENVKIIAPKDIKGYYTFMRYPSHDTITKAELVRVNDTLIAGLPGQPPAGKIKYDIVLQDEQGNQKNITDKSVIIRFKGYTPTWIIVLHVIFIFSAMILSLRTGFEAYAKGASINTLMKYTIFAILMGGFVFGPIMQYYAFGAFWTGFPFGIDLTDNKTLIGLIAWLIALWRFKKNPDNPIPVIIASIVFVIVFLIPHSVLGSEIDHTKAVQ